MILKKRNKYLLIIFLLFSLFIKIDFRLKPELECCNDDHDYYSHAETTVIDFDFDYENQLKGFEKSRNFINEKTSPVGFYGAGLLSSPFLLIGNIIDNIFYSDNQKLYSNKVLLYSFSSIFYLLLTLLIFKKIKNIINIHFSNMKLLIVLLGTGLPYYAFERYSMTHVYDTFAVTALIYYLIMFYKEGDGKYLLGLSIFIFITLIIRWTNYQVFILPLIIQKLFFPNSKYRIRKKNWFYFYTIISTFLFLIHTKLIWGIFTLNPRKIYNDHDFISYYVNSFFENPFSFILNNFYDAIITLFTQEFGVFWFSPVIFVGVLFILISFRINFQIRLLLFVLFSYYFSLINAWQSTGNAYGFRYLYPLISISVLLMLYLKKENFKFYKLIEYYVLIFSILSILSILFFEGWEGSQLSLRLVENSYGKVEKFINPTYLTGLLKGFLIIETYLKIFTTSFLSLLGFRFLLYFYEIEEINYFLNMFGLPVQDQDFQLFLLKVDSLNLVSISIILLFLLVVTYTTYFYLDK